MVDTRYQDILEQILTLLDSACQAGLELLELYAAGNEEAVNALLSDLREVSRVTGMAQEPLLPQLDHACTAEMLENIDGTLEEIQDAIRSGSGQRAARKIEFQLLPFLRCLREAFYFWGAVYPDREKMERYYREEFAEHYQNWYGAETGEGPVRLTIIVTAYNHLETTKRCIEQLLRETDFEKLHAELFLIDHGSTDGTLEYFESLGVGNVIHFKRNVRMYMFAILPMICRGTYFSFVSNDILVTRNWAEILLNCLDSDEKIIAAVPATPHIANLQSLGLPESSPEEFVAWAAQQNQAGPSLWDDRARLMPPLGMYRREAVSRIGFADPYFYSMEYWDDDFSLRARRAGYRQIVCNDVSCYHFGSVTGGAEQVQGGTLAYGRDLFLKKHGIDAWGVGFCYDYTAVHFYRQLPVPQAEPAILGLDCGMGDTPLQIRNELRHQGRRGEIYQLTSQEAYLPDICSLSEEALFSHDLAEGVRTAFAGREFSTVYLGRDMAEYEDSEALLSAVSGRLTPGGWLIFFCSNPYDAVRLYALLQFSMPEGKVRHTMVDPLAVQRQAEQYFAQVRAIPLERQVTGLEEFARAHFGQTEQFPEIVKRLSVEKYYFVCGK